MDFCGAREQERLPAARVQQYFPLGGCLCVALSKGKQQCEWDELHLFRLASRYSADTIRTGTLSRRIHPPSRVERTHRLFIASPPFLRLLAAGCLAFVSPERRTDSPLESPFALQGKRELYL